MKPHYCILFIFLALIFFACNSTEKIEETSPKFNFPTDTIFTSYHDALRIQGSFRTGFHMDSVAAGDTAWFRIDINGVFNRLTEINVALSDNSVAELLFLDQAYMDSTFLSWSNFSAGQFLVTDGKMRIPFKFGYHAIQFSRNVSLTLTAHSDANDDNNTNNFTLCLPIKRTPPPQFTFPTGTLVTEQNDSLQIRIVSGIHRLDAMAIGDAVELNIEISGMRNNLTRLKMTPRNYRDAEVQILDTSKFLTSDFERGIFEMDGSFSTLVLPLKIFAKEASEDFDIIFEAHSNALFDYGISKIELRIPISEFR